MPRDDEAVKKCTGHDWDQLLRITEKIQALYKRSPVHNLFLNVSKFIHSLTASMPS